MGLPEGAWRITPWREGSKETLSSRFAAVRIRPASRDWKRSTPHPLEWLLIEWPEGDEILAFDPARRHAHRRSRRHGQTALAHRARLSGTQAGGRARPFRRPRMARLSPSRHPVHRSLWIPDLRKGDDSPLRTSSRQVVQRTCRSRRLPTPRRRPCAPSVTFQIQSQPCDAASPSPSPSACHDAVPPKSDTRTPAAAKFMTQ